MVRIHSTGSIISLNSDAPAMMTNRQFSAIAKWLEQTIIMRELSDLSILGRLQICESYEEGVVAQWLKNGWNTEQLLRISAGMFDKPEQGYALQWAFPQAYYSVFAVTAAFFITRGQTERKHGSIIKRVGVNMIQDEYPRRMSFLALGGLREIELKNISKYSTRSTLAFDINNPQSVETQIAQFLSGTRKKELQAKKKEVRLRSSQGTLKKNYSLEDWRTVSERLGPTSLLSLLYRKRIKANYGAIDTYLSNELEVAQLFQSLLTIVEGLNLVHEAFLACAMGRERNEALYSKARASMYDFVVQRGEMIRKTV
ncbi:hypothetical protein ACFL44_00695 [Gemmatimonadota bacterium]